MLIAPSMTDWRRKKRGETLSSTRRFLFFSFGLTLMAVMVFPEIRDPGAEKITIPPSVISVRMG